MQVSYCYFLVNACVDQTTRFAWFKTPTRDSGFICFRSVGLFACSSCSCLFSIASRFKSVLGPARTANVGIGVPVAKAQHPVIVVVGQPTLIPPPNRSYPSSHRKIGNSPCHINPNAQKHSQTCSSAYLGRLHAFVAKKSTRVSLPGNSAFGCRNAPVWHHFSFRNRMLKNTPKHVLGYN